MEDLISLNIINFTDMARREEYSFMGYEKSFIIMKLIWQSQLVSNPNNCARETPTESDINPQIKIAGNAGLESLFFMQHFDGIPAQEDWKSPQNQPRR